MLLLLARLHESLKFKIKKKKNNFYKKKKMKRTFRGGVFLIPKTN